MELPNGVKSINLITRGIIYIKEIVCGFRSLLKATIYPIRLVGHTKGDALIHPWGVTVNPPNLYLMET